MTIASSKPRVLLLTEQQLPELIPDEQPLIAAFRAAGCDVRPAVWSDPVPDADLALIRTTWDYTSRLREFLSALETISKRMTLWNPIETVRWNIDKRYLLELAAAGIAMPATTVCTAGSGATLDQVMQELGSRDLVVKPLVGAGGRDTWRAAPGCDAEWSAALAARDLLVQRYLPEVTGAGEWSLMFINGTFTHATLKRPAEGEFRVQEDHGGTWTTAVPSASAIRAAEQVLGAVPYDWRYARVDGVMVDGAFLLMEVELIEPQLFFPAAPIAASMLVEAATGLRLTPDSPGIAVRP